MSHEFEIKELKSQILKSIANKCDELGNNNGKIDGREFSIFKNHFEGNNAFDAEFQNEAENIKAMFGYTSSVTDTPAADKDVKSTHAKEIKNAYYRYRGIDVITREPLKDADGKPVKGMSPKEAYEAVKAEYKANGKYKEYKKYIKDLRKYSIDVESKLVALDALEKSSSDKALTRKHDAEDTLKANGNWDKHTKKALNGNNHNWWSNTLNWLSGSDSQMKKMRKAQAYGQKAEEKAQDTYTKEDFTKAIGKRCPLFQEDADGYLAIQKITNVQGVPLVTKKDGKFDISVLSEFISSKIGADNTLSRESNKADAEIEAIRSEFRTQGIELTKRDTKQLVEFCGYHVEKKNYAKAAYTGTVGALAGAAGTATALLTQGHDIFRGDITNTNHLELNLKMDNAFNIDMQALLNDDKIAQMIKDNVLNIEQSEFGLQIIVDQKDVQPYLFTASKHIPLNILKSAATGAAVGILAGMLEFGQSEENVFSSRFDCRTYEQFIKYVDSRKELRDEQKIALKQIALNFIVSEKGKDGKEYPKTIEQQKRDSNNQLVFDAAGKPIMEKTPQIEWRCDDFKDYLNRIAGYPSDLNAEELMLGISDAKNERLVVNPQDNNDGDDGNVDGNGGSDNDNVDGNEGCPECETRQETKYVPTDIPTTRFNKWDDLSNGYSCLNKYPLRLKNRMMKVIQAMDTTNIKTEDEFKKFYDIQKIAAFAADAIKFGTKKAIEKHPDFPIKEQEYKKLLDAEAGVKGNVYVPELYDSETNETCSWTMTKTRVTDKSGKGFADVSTKKGLKNGDMKYYKKCPGESGWQEITKDEYDALQKKS